MIVTISIQCRSEDEAIVTLAKLKGEKVSQVSSTVATAERVKFGKHSPKKAAAIEAIKAMTDDVPKSAKRRFTDEQAQTALTSLYQRRGDEVTKGLLARFGATKLTEVPADKVDEFVDAAAGLWDLNAGGGREA